MQRPNLPPPGSRIGPYVVERELARGGMGVVYVARHPELERTVALKLLPADADARLLERFAIEARAAARLRHPNIVAIHDVGQDGGRSYLTMDLIEGESLAARVARAGPFPPREAVALIAKLAHAMAYAHERSILHRDIKPANVLVDGRGEPFLVDFGLAKDVSREATGLTVAGQILGTPAYMPPEQAEGNPELIDRRCDVYSLGATLFETLTGRPPFLGPTIVNVIAQLVENEAPLASRTAPTPIDADLDTICACCLEKEPDQRYPTAGSLARDLDRWLAGEPIRARPIGAVTRLLRRARRNRSLVAAGSIAVLAVVAVWAVMTWRLAASLERERGAHAAAELAREAEATARREEEAAREDAERREELERARRALERGYGLLGRDRHRAAAAAFIEAAELTDGLRATHLDAAEAVALAARRGTREVARRAGHLVPTSGRYHSAVAITPDGGRIAAATEAGAVDLVDVDAGTTVARIAGLGPIAGLAFSPDGSILAVAEAYGRDGAVASTFLVDGRRLDHRRTLPHAGSGAAAAVAWLPDGSRLLGATLGTGDVLVWDPATGALVQRLVGRARPGCDYDTDAYGIVPTADGRRVVVAYADGTAWGWDLATGRPGAVAHVTTPLRFAAVAPPGFLSPATAVTGDTEGRVLAWVRGDAGSSPRAHVLASNLGGRVTTGALHPGVGLLAVGFRNGSVGVWDGGGARIRDLPAHRGPVAGCAFSADGRSLATGGDGPIRIWDTSRIRRFDGRGPVSIDSDRVAHVATGGGAIEVRDRDTGARVVSCDVTIIPGQTAIRALALSPDGSRVAVAVGAAPRRAHLDPGPHHRVEVRAVEGGRILATIETPLVVSVAWTADGRRLVVGCERNEYVETSRGRAIVIDLDAPGDPPVELRWHVLPVDGVAVARRGDSVVTSSRDGLVTFRSNAVALAGEPPDRVVHPGRGSAVDGPDPSEAPTQPPGRTEVERWGIRALAFGAEGDTLAAATGEVVALIALGDGATIGTVPVDAHEVVDVGFGGDARMLVTASRDGSIRVWDLIDPGAPRVLRQESVPGSVSLSDADVAADGSGVAAAVATLDRSSPSVWVWDLQTPPLDGFDQDPRAALERATGWR